MIPNAFMLEKSRNVYFEITVLVEITILAKNVKPNKTMVLYNDWCINSMFTFSEDNSYGTAINIFKNIRPIEFKFHNWPSIYTQSTNKIFVGILILSYLT